MMNTENLETRLGKRRAQAYQLRKEGLLFKQVGQRMGICPGGALRLYNEVTRLLTRDAQWHYGLGMRAYRTLDSININSRQEALEAYQSGRLHPGMGFRNYGWKTHKELARWLGLPEPQRPGRKTVCPHCGGEL